MKKIMAILLVSLGLFGCQFHSNKSFTFHVETKDDINVTCDTTDDYDLRQKDGHFYVDKDGEEISAGSFITEKGYAYYVDAVKQSSDAKILKEGKTDAIEYVTYTTKGKSGQEYNSIIWIQKSHTGVLLGSLNKEHYEDVFKRLSFEKES